MRAPPLPPDAREYGIGSQILADLGPTSLRVLTNNPKKVSGIAGFGLTVASQEPIEIEPGPENLAYLQAKRDKLGHDLHHRGLGGAADGIRVRDVGEVAAASQRP